MRIRNKINKEQIEQKVFIGENIKQINVDSWIIILENIVNRKLVTEVILLRATAPNDCDEHQYYCDYSILENYKDELIGKILQNIIVKRIKDWFLLKLNIVIDENKSPYEFKDIKCFIPSYSNYWSYYTDDVNLAIYKNQELIIESLAKYNWRNVNESLEKEDF